MESLKIEKDKVICAECGQQVGKDGETKLSFCPKCGNPLNINALEQFEKKVAKQTIVTLYEAIDEIEDGEDALEVLNRYIKELNN